MNTCPICANGVLQMRRYARDMQHKGVALSVENLQCGYCPDCDLEMTSPTQIDHNAKMIRAAFIVERARIKCEQHLLTGAEIRSLREKMGLTQKQASRVFGGGLMAFAKYEAEEVVQSMGMDKLLRLADGVPEATKWLLNHAEGGSVGVRPSQMAHLHTGGNLFRNDYCKKESSVANLFTEMSHIKHGKFEMNQVISECHNDRCFENAA